MYKGLLHVGWPGKVPLKSWAWSEEKELAKRTSGARVSEKLQGKNEWEASHGAEAGRACSRACCVAWDGRVGSQAGSKSCAQHMFIERTNDLMIPDFKYCILLASWLYFFFSVFKFLNLFQS